MISILIPAYNEAKSIAETVERVHQTFTELDVVYEIVVIDDGSQDNTWDIINTLDVNPIRHASNCGYGHSLKTGIRHAKYDWCAIIDADGTYPVQQFKDLLPYVGTFDMVVGARTGDVYWGSRAKRLSRLILIRLIAFIIGEQIPDPNSGMRIFRKSIALAHIKRISSGFSFTVTITLAMFLNHHFVKYVPIEYYERVGNSKVRMQRDILRVLQILSQAVIYYNPLKLYLILCLLSFGLGILGWLFLIIFFPGVWSWIVLILSIQISIVIGAIGFLAEAIHLARD